MLRESARPSHSAFLIPGEHQDDIVAQRRIGLQYPRRLQQGHDPRAIVSRARAGRYGVIVSHQREAPRVRFAREPGQHILHGAGAAALRDRGFLHLHFPADRLELADQVIPRPLQCCGPRWTRLNGKAPAVFHRAFCGKCCRRGCRRRWTRWLGQVQAEQGDNTGKAKDADSVNPTARRIWHLPQRPGSSPSPFAFQYPYTLTLTRHKLQHSTINYQPVCRRVSPTTGDAPFRPGRLRVRILHAAPISRRLKRQHESAKWCVAAA